MAALVEQLLAGGLEPSPVPLPEPVEDVPVGTAFERFARGDAARARNDEGGVGLGLSLVKAIVTAHGGTVSLASRPGDTTVTVRLPSRGPVPPVLTAD